MNSYFINHTGPRERGLQDARVPFESFRIGRQDGILFEDGYLNQVLTALNSRIEREERSSYEGINILHLGRGAEVRPAAVPVRYEGSAEFSSQSRREEMASIAQEFAAHFGAREIVFVENGTHNGAAIEPRQGAETLHVIMWASPTGQRNENTDTHLFGHQVANSRHHWAAFNPSGQGEAIVDERGAAVAELIGNNLYVLYPLTDGRMEPREAIMRRIFEEALLLRCTPEEQAERQRQRDAQLLEEMRRNPVEVQRWDASREPRDKFVAIAKEFAPAFGKPIVIHNYADNATTHRLIRNGRLHICIYGVPRSLETGIPMPPTLFGAKITTNDRLFFLKDWGEGTPLTDEDGNQFGSLLDGTVYILFPLGRTYLRLRWNDQGSDALFRRILEEVVFVMTATEEEKASRAREYASKNRVRSREEYMQACNGRFEKALASTRRALETGPREVEELQQKLVRRIREVNGLQRKLEQMENSRSGAIEVYGKEFDKLLEMEKIRDVRVRDGVVQVFTDTLFCVDPRSQKTHEIGHFRIDFNPNGEVRWFNLDRKISGYGNGMQAPHVFPDGRACLGNMQEVIPELIANYEYAALAMVCINFVESVNVEDDAGRHINRWPVAA